MRFLMTFLLAMSCTGTALVQMMSAEGQIHASNEEFELQRLEKSLTEAKRKQFGFERSDLMIQVSTAMNAVLDELNSHGHVSWHTERAFWKAALAAVFGNETHDAVRTRREVLLSGLQPRALPLPLQEWQILAARLECLSAADDAAESLKALVSGGKGSLVLLEESTASRGDAAVALSECLIDRIPCQNAGIKAGLLLDLKVKYARESYWADLRTWSYLQEMKRGGAGTSYEEARARRNLFRSLAILHTLELQRDRRGGIAEN